MAPKPVIERPIMSHSNTTMAAAAERAQPQPAETAAAADFAATDARMELRTRVQSPPLLFTPDGHNAFLGDMYRGRAAFLLCGGPSLLSHDLGRLRRQDRGRPEGPPAPRALQRAGGAGEIFRSRRAGVAGPP